MTTLETLVAARDIIAKGAWTKGCAARDGSGEPVSATDPRAVCWCAWGALMHVGKPSLGAERLFQALDILPVNGSMLHPLFDWNDGATREEVVAAFDRAIELERANDAP